VSPKPEQPSPIGLAAEWVARLTVVGVEMVLFGFGGVWLDKRLHVEPLFALLGFAVGIGVGIFHLLLMTAQDRKGQKPDSASHEPRAKPRDAGDRETDE
jgi:F0F1-type ATP synthase assembly protein I